MKKVSLAILLIMFSNTAWAGTQYTTLPATQITATNAILNGQVASTVSITGVFFEYGTTTKYGTNVAGQRPQEASGTVSVNIFDLECNTTYHFRFYGPLAGPTTQGTDMTFTTLACEPPPQMVCSVISPGFWRDTIPALGTWTVATCEKYMTVVNASEYQIGCLGSTGVVFGAAGSAGTPAGKPAPNCGW